MLGKITIININFDLLLLLLLFIEMIMKLSFKYI